MFNKTDGLLQQVAGGIQDAFGSLAGSPGHQVEGKLRRAAGQAEVALSEAVDQARTTARRHPAGTLTIVAGVAFILGVLWSRD